MVKKLFLLLWSLSLCAAPLLCEQTHLVIEPGVLTEKPTETEKEEEAETLPEKTTEHKSFDKHPLYKITIGCSSVLAVLHGLGMYYYPKKTALFVLSYTAGTFLGISIADWYIFSHDNDYADYMKSEARKNLLYTSITTGLCAGYYMSVFKTGAHA